MDPMISGIQACAIAAHLRNEAVYIVGDINLIEPLDRSFFSQPIQWLDFNPASIPTTPITLLVTSIESFVSILPALQTCPAVRVHLTGGNLAQVLALKPDPFHFIRSCNLPDAFRQTFPDLPVLHYLDPQDLPTQTSPRPPLIHLLTQVFPRLFVADPPFAFGFGQVLARQDQTSDWIVGEDGLEEVVRSGLDLNLLVGSSRREMGLWAMRYGGCYVASVSRLSAEGIVRALVEADAYQGPSVVLVDLAGSLDWPCYRWYPRQELFVLDSESIGKEVEGFLARENIFSLVVNKDLPSLETKVKKDHKELLLKAKTDRCRFTSESTTDPLTILFGSDNGHAESLAQKIARQAQSKGFQVKCMAMDDYQDLQALGHETHLILVCSTAGQGEFPSNGRNFWRALQTLPPGHLIELKYAVFGLGDSHYWPRKEDVEFFNRPGKRLDGKLDTLGARRLVPLGLGDDQEGFETAFENWLPTLWTALGIHDHTFQEVVYTEDQLKLDSDYLRGKIAQELSDYSTRSVTETTGRLLRFHGILDDPEETDRFLVRVNRPGGVVSPKQWLALDTLSDRYGNKSFKVMRRQAFQLHGVLKKNLRTTVRQLNKASMTTLGASGDVNRNITCSLTDITEVHEQVQALVSDLARLLTPSTSAYYEIWLDNSMVAARAAQDSEPLYGPCYLPQKLKVAIAVPPHNDVDVYAHDLGLVAIVDTHQKKVLGYNVLVGGSMEYIDGNRRTYPRPASLIGYVPAEHVMEIAKSVVILQRDHGNRTDRKYGHFKYTVDRLGLEFIKREIEKQSGVLFEEARLFEFQSTLDRYGWRKGKDGTWNFTLFIEQGRIKDTAELRYKAGLRDLARFHKGEFRLTPNQHLVIANVPESDLEKTKAHLEKYSIDNMRFLSHCKGSMAHDTITTCGLTVVKTERYLPRLISRLEEMMEEAGLSSGAIVLYMTDSSLPYLAELGLVQKALDVYDLYLGGSRQGDRLNMLYRENMQEEDIIHELAPIIRGYVSERSNDESFGDWVIRAGYVKRIMTGKDFYNV